MSELRTFISNQFRPEVFGGRLDKRHKSRFKLVQEECSQTLNIEALCFGPKKDNVLITLEHAIRKADGILILYYEDIHTRWSYVNANDGMYFLYQKNRTEQYKIKPKYLYIRGCYIEPSDPYWNRVGDFFNFVEMWTGTVLCSPGRQISNESKLYQLNTSLMKAAKKTPSISIGKSYVVKGLSCYQYLPKDKSYIVKSLSGVRSIVVDKTEYDNWDLRNVDNNPVLFQEKVNGNDVRVHIINEKIFAKRSSAKEKIDYRYDRNFFNLADDQPSQELNNFCVAVAYEEKNQLLGLDFIQTEQGYVVLEANPSPGWSAYHPYNGIDKEPFVTELLKVLKSA